MLVRHIAVGRVEELPPGSCRLVAAGRYGIGVFNVGGTFSAVTNYCPHRGAPLCRGQVTGLAEPGDEPYEIAWSRQGEILRCPWHAWEFEIRSGRSITEPTKSVRTYPVVVRNGWVEVEIPATSAEGGDQ